MERVAELGGANGPFEMIFQYVVGYAPMPDREWYLVRTWRAISRCVSLAWMQYNRDVETVGPNAGRE